MVFDGFLCCDWVVAWLFCWVCVCVFGVVGLFGFVVPGMLFGCLFVCFMCFFCVVGVVLLCLCGRCVVFVCCVWFVGCVWGGVFVCLCLDAGGVLLFCCVCLCLC